MNSRPIWQFHRLTIMSRQLTAWLLEERIDLCKKFTTALSNSDPRKNHSLHFRNNRGENLALKSPLIATRKLVPTMSQVDMATRKLAQTISAVLPVVLPFKKDYHSCERKEVDSYSRQFFVRRSCVTTGFAKWLQGWYVHHDHENEKPAGSYHWGTVRPVFLKAFGKHGV